MGALVHMIRKEFQQLRRDPVMLRVALVAPALQLLVLGYAANLDVTRVQLVIADLDRTATSRQVVADFLGSGYFEAVGSAASAADAEPWLTTGRAQLALVLAPGFGRAVLAGRPAAVQVLVDGAESIVATLGMGYATQVLSARSAALARLQVEALRLAAGRGAAAAPAGLLQSVPRVWYNPDLRSRWFYIPAVLALVLMLATTILASMGVVREKEIGTLEQLMVTPLRGWQIIAGKLLPFALVGIVDLFLVLGIAVAWFGVPLRGSLVLLVALSLVLILNTLSLGLLVSTIVRTQQQAMMASAFLVMFPMIYLSGLFFPTDSMPAALRNLSYVVPLRYYAEILRGIFLRGAGLAALWDEALILLGFGVAFLALASARFRKRV